MPGVDTQDDLDLIVSTATEAGKIALSFFRNNPKTWTKGKASSVSEADIAVDDYLKQALLEARPDYGWLSEETVDSADRLSAKRLFVADPIDGTKGYLAGDAQWCISIAVVDGDAPVAGVLHAPALGKTYLAKRGGGAFCNDMPLNGGSSPPGQIICAGTPRDAAWATFGPFAKAPFVPSLALRLAFVASGEFGAAFARPHAYDWDIAAAQLIVEESGGLVVDGAGNVPRYNRQDLTHPALGAFGASTRAMLNQGQS